MKKANIKLLLRIVHFLIVIYFVFGIVYIYYSAFTENTGVLLNIFVVSLIAEGIIIYFNHGNCPFGYFQKMAGDDTPFFELILPKKYAIKAVRFFAIITLIGIVLLLF